MEDETTRLSFFKAFAEHVHIHRDAIGSRWMPLVRESPEVRGAMHISHEALQDHVPELVDDLVELLRLEHQGSTLEKKGTQEVAADHSRSHGREQWKAGYNVSELIWEIYIIRRVLTESVLGDFARHHPEYSREECAGAETFIHDFFHRLTCNSVGQFIEEKQNEVREINDSRERLTRTVSHELRNVLNALTLATTLLAEGAEDERRDMGLVCARMLSDMTRILNNLLDYSTLMAGHKHHSVERFDLRELFEEIVSQWRPLVEESGLTFEGQYHDSLGEIVSDRLKLKQIANNLLSNSIKYRKPAQGGGVRISFLPQGLRWKMVVADTGIGIAAKHIGALFVEFSRIQPSGNVPGSGLGLAICKEFAELLGGEIEVYSEVEQGTRFEVTLPRSMVVTEILKK